MVWYRIADNAYGPVYMLSSGQQLAVAFFSSNYHVELNSTELYGSPYAAQADANAAVAKIVEIGGVVDLSAL